MVAMVDGNETWRWARFEFVLPMAMVLLIVIVIPHMVVAPKDEVEPILEAASSGYSHCEEVLFVASMLPLPDNSSHDCLAMTGSRLGFIVLGWCTLSSGWSAAR
ncbi:hypothetical protein V6N11_049192 [Hibiscus sabdariffa]|uniref:Uncharacterized protein n=1 Tax=Hibiscus sabdariffa TaxID=183260 RepID=A0ABR2NK84_9ROSI